MHGLTNTEAGSATKKFNEGSVRNVDEHRSDLWLVARDGLAVHHMVERAAGEGALAGQEAEGDGEAISEAAAEADPAAMAEAAAEADARIRQRMGGATPSG